MEKNRLNQITSFLLAVGILLLFAFSKKEETDSSIEYTYYDEMMILNEKVNAEKRTIISTLENIAYKEWEIDSVSLFLSKYPLMDSVLLRKLHDIEFEFGYSNLLEKIESNQSISPGSLTDSAMEQRVENETDLLKDELKLLNDELIKHKTSLDSLRSQHPFKYYLNQARYNN